MEQDTAWDDTNEFAECGKESKKGGMSEGEIQGMAIYAFCVQNAQMAMTRDRQKKGLSTSGVSGRVEWLPQRRTVCEKSLFGASEKGCMLSPVTGAT